MAAAKFKPVDEQFSYLKKGTAEIIREDELKAKLEKSAATGKPLRVYLGVDPTAPDIHLGHTVVLRKLKHFQDMGHTAIFMIGDFSAMIGDPTGVSETRPPLTREQVDANARTYLGQVYKILDREKTEVRYNSEWLGKMSSYEIVRLCGHYRLARMLEREDFRSRLARDQHAQDLQRIHGPSEPTRPQHEGPAFKLPSSGKVPAVKQPGSISIHELLYPLLTAYDAVMLESDVEIGATEQKFNMLVHRDIQREYEQTGQIALTMPILVGLDGERKMSKSLGNYVGITEPPGEMFGKLMSISDELMWSYYELLTDFPWPAITRLREEVRTGVMHPKKAKMELAHNIVTGFHGEAAARDAGEEWDRIFSKREAPEDAPRFAVARNGMRRLSLILVELKAAPSRSEAERLIKQGGVEIDGVRVEDVKREIDLSKPAEYLLRAGKKKFLRLVVE